MELGAPEQGLQPGKSGEHGWRRLVLLLRDQLTRALSRRSTERGHFPIPAEASHGRLDGFEERCKNMRQKDIICDIPILLLDGGGRSYRPKETNPTAPVY